MWIFTEAADWFDRQRVANNKFLDQSFQGWVDYAVQHENERGYWPALRNAMIYTGTGLLYGLNQVTTSVASGFVDTLRIGDGVRQGGWGYGQDALRLLSVVGAAAKPLNAVLKVGRLGLANLVAVDLAPNLPICTWVASAKALVMTGTRHFATVRTIEDTMGWPGLADRAVFLGELLSRLRRLGANVADVGAGARALSGNNVEEALMGVLKANPDAIVPFSVVWNWGGAAGIREFASVAPGETVGHTMVAFLQAFSGELRILDRTGQIFRTFEELEASGYSNIRNATFYARPDTALIIRSATIVPLLRSGQALSALAQSGAAAIRGPDGALSLDCSWLEHGIGLEIRSVPMRTERRRVVNIPLRVAAAKGQVRTQTFCVPILRNSDAPADAATEDCSVLHTYVVETGDTLAAVAQTVYGNPQRWRGIAALNGIKDPDRLQPGMILVIP